MGEFRKDIRNVAIIAHVDHGKTTLVDGLLAPHRCAFRDGLAGGGPCDGLGRTSNASAASRSSRRDTAIDFEGVRIQLVDTPGHADFGGEVERVLGMVDAVLLLVDAVEGVMPQTRFVVGKALEHGLRPILVVNKIDRPEQRADEVVDEVFDLLVELGARRRAARLPGRLRLGQGRAGRPRARRSRADRPAPAARDHPRARAGPEVDDTEGPLQFQAVTLDYDDYLGRLVIGRVERGRCVRGPDGRARPRGGRPRASFRVTKLLGSRGLERAELDEAGAGDIAVIAGVDDRSRSATPSAIPRHPDRLPRIAIDPPTIRVRFSVNTSPFAGRRALPHQPADRRAPRARGPRQRLDPGRAESDAPRTPSRWRGAASCRSRSSSRPCAARATSSASRGPRSSARGRRQAQLRARRGRGGRGARGLTPAW